MVAREPKEVELAKTAIFVRGTRTGERLNHVMQDLMALKRPDAISFSKKNTVHPFEDASSLEFWSVKNDAALFVVGLSTKKRPDGLIFARTFDGRILDMCEVGVTDFKGLDEFKTKKSTPGHRPIMHFASELFDTHPRFVQLKSFLLDFFNGEAIESICLAGIEHVISVSLSPTPPNLSTSTDEDKPSDLPTVHIRTYSTRLLASGTRTPRVELTPMGPSLDLVLRRHQLADPEVMKLATKKPKLKKQEVEKGLGKKRKNMEVDEMGDLRGRIHVGKQELGKLQVRKMKGLKEDGRLRKKPKQLSTQED